jgi:predicted GH43/DUF377 family glycosyl hydrolase
MDLTRIASLETHVDRLGVALEPNGEPTELEGVLNPACTRTRDGKLLLYPRTVAKGNVSRVGIVEASGPRDQPTFVHAGFALEPEMPYEFRDLPGGFGCEDPRVTFVPLLDSYVMAYTAFGPSGPRIAFALSNDGYEWRRLGLADFSAPGLPHGDDKDAAFFPEPVLSPKGVWSFAFYHRPMIHIHASDGRAAVPIILAMPPRDRECTRIAYVPVEAVLADRRNLLRVAESVIVLEPTGSWGRIKNGGGTPPVRVAEGWLSLFHGVDGRYDQSDTCIGMCYSAGLLIHDAERPDILRYRSAEPLFAPETAGELRGMVGSVVFPTGIDPRLDARDYDVYYGMADSRIGRIRVQLGSSVAASASEAQESAA